MKKKSPLQYKIISRIDDFCGIEKFIEKLNSHKLNLPANEKIMFASMVLYSQNLYLSSVPCEEDFVVYREASFKCLNLLEMHIKKTNCKYLTLLHGNILLGISEAKDLRFLA